MISGQKLILAAVIGAAFVGPVFAGVPLTALENAYWNFEEGTPGELVAASSPDEKVGTVLDITNNGNSMRRFGEDNAPIYTADVPGPVVPATGAANNVALGFQGTFRDIYTDGRDINNPEVYAFTLEASFKAITIFGDGYDQAIVSKESKRDLADPSDCNLAGNDCLSDAPPLSLKILGDGPPLLMIQVRDAANVLTQVVSLEPIQVGQWYHAAVVATDTELKLYLDSLDGEGYVLQGTAEITGGGPLWMGGLDGNNNIVGYDTVWNIGKGMWARELAHSFGYGAIDEVRLSNTALQPSDFLWYQPMIPGDLNLDRKVNEADLDIFIACATGSGVGYDPVPAGCPLTLDEGRLSADLDSDGDVDMTDFGILQTHYTGD